MVVTSTVILGLEVSRRKVWLVPGMQGLEISWSRIGLDQRLLGLEVSWRKVGLEPGIQGLEISWSRIGLDHRLL